MTIHGGPATELTIVNKTSASVKVYWIDGSGKNSDYGFVDANGETTLQTYVDHAWLLEGGNGEKAKYRAVEGEGLIILEPGWGQPKEEKLAIRTKETRDLSEARNAADGEIFVRDGNVWIKDSEGELQVTHVEEDPAGFRFDPWNIKTSPDGKFAVVWKYTPDDPNGYTLYRIESTPADQLQPKLHSSSYPKPGQKVRIDRPCMFDIDAKREVPTDDALFSNPYGIRDSELGWSPDSQEYRFEFNERGHNNLRIIGINREGAIRAIVDDSSDTFIDYSQKRAYRLSPDATELIWASERDGWNHLYLYDMQSGQVKNQITKGEWVVREIEQISWETREIRLTVYGINPSEDPYYAHLARVHLDDGSQFTLLTPGNGTHTWKYSPPDPTTGNTPSYLLDTYSRIDQLPVTILRSSSTGDALVTIEEDATSALVSEGYIPPQIFVAPGRDNQTPIYGMILPPSNLDPTKKYPILEDIYASPHNFFTPKAFQSTWDLSSQYELTSANFVVVKLDGMGTNWRSKAFHSVCHKNLKDAGLPDRIAWIKSAASTRPWMDLSRVGIYGGSAGGQSAVSALIFHHDDENPPFYKAAAADCGCHDNRIDKLWWNEAWMGWPLDESYEANSNIAHADKLKGQVLLTVGEMDDNVDPASTLQLVKRLNDLGNHDYEMLYMPGLEHGAGGGDYGRVRRLRFFQRVLGGPVDV